MQTVLYVMLAGHSMSYLQQNLLSQVVSGSLQTFILSKRLMQLLSHKLQMVLHAEQPFVSQPQHLSHEFSLLPDQTHLYITVTPFMQAAATAIG